MARRLSSTPTQMLHVASTKIVTSTKSAVTITAWDLDLVGSLTAGTLAITIHGAQASQTIGLGSSGNMDNDDTELGRITAEAGVTLGNDSSGSIVVDGVTS